MNTSNFRQLKTALLDLRPVYVLEKWMGYQVIILEPRVRLLDNQTVKQAFDLV